MATTAFVTEFRSFMSFQCKSPSQVSDQYKAHAPEMAPCQNTEAELQECNNAVQPYTPPSEQNPDSSMSSMGASVESFSPEMNGEDDRSSSDDSHAMTSEQEMQDASRQYPENFLSPMMQMQAVYGRTDVMFQHSIPHESTNNSQNVSRDSKSSNKDGYCPSDTNGFRKCNLCDYVSMNEREYIEHAEIHLSYKCSFCQYSARTKGRLNLHVTRCHTDVPPGTPVRGKKSSKMSDGSGVDSCGNVPSTSKTKSRITKCKMCNFVGSSKDEYYQHLRTAHEDSGKILVCNQCDFATSYKHHLEYHLRNHFGSKPFKCNLCKYSCVNKSMLNSHKKSHSNVYQFHCAGCSYATKYCHSLKMHLRKYDHKPGETLNADGTPNTNSVIDVHGRRRGPKPKRRKLNLESNLNQPSTTTSIIPPPPPPLPVPPISSPPSMSFGRDLAPLPTMVGPVYYHHPYPQIYNNFGGNMVVRNQPALNTSNCRAFRPPVVNDATCHMFGHPLNDQGFHMFRPPTFRNPEGCFQSPYFSNYATDRMDLLTNTTNGFQDRQVENRPSPISGAENHSDSENRVGNDQVLDLSYKRTNLVPVKDDSGPTSTTKTKSDTSEQNGHCKPASRNRRKGKAFKLDYYVTEDDVPPTPPTQDEWKQENPLKFPQACTFSPSLSNGISNMKYKTDEQCSGENLMGILKNNNSVPEMLQQNGRSNNQQYMPKTQSPTVGMSNVVVKLEPIDTETEASGDIVGPKAADCFRCQFCDLIFGDAKMYATHMRNHTPGDPFTCGRCGVKCYDRVTLFDHFTYTIHPEEDEDVCITGVVRR